jgi:hypothetical protein
LAVKITVNTPPFNPSYTAAFGANERDLDNYIRRNMQYWRLLFPNATFTVSSIQKVYWKLDAVNFCVILNQGSNQASTDTWDQIPFLPKIFNLGSTYANITSSKSPRATWSHGH